MEADRVKKSLRGYRLRRSEDYQRVYERGRKFVDRLLVLFALCSQWGKPRVGISVSRRLGKAVKRNRLKRRLREMIRLRIDRFPPLDIVFVARRGAAEASFADLERAVERGLEWLSGWQGSIRSERSGCGSS